MLIGGSASNDDLPTVIHHAKKVIGICSQKKGLLQKVMQQPHFCHPKRQLRIFVSTGKIFCPFGVKNDRGVQFCPSPFLGLQNCSAFRVIR